MATVSIMQTSLRKVLTQKLSEILRIQILPEKVTKKSLKENKKAIAVGYCFLACKILAG